MNESECKMVVEYIKTIEESEPDLAFSTILLLERIMHVAQQNIPKQVNNNAL